MVRKVLVQAAPEEDVQGSTQGFGGMIALLADAFADFQHTFMEEMGQFQEAVPETSRLAPYGW